MKEVFSCPKCGSKFNRDIHYKKILDMQNFITTVSGGEEIIDMCSSCNFLVLKREVYIKTNEGTIQGYIKIGNSLAVVDASIIDLHIRPDGSEGKIGYFNRINVPKQDRSNGIGTELLKSLLNECREQNIALICEINPYGDLTYEQLDTWYRKYGFKGYEGVLWYIP